MGETTMSWARRAGRVDCVPVRHGREPGRVDHGRVGCVSRVCVCMGAGRSACSAYKTQPLCNRNDIELEGKRKEFGRSSAGGGAPCAGRQNFPCLYSSRRLPPPVLVRARGEVQERELARASAFSFQINMSAPESLKDNIIRSATTSKQPFIDSTRSFV